MTTSNDDLQGLQSAVLFLYSDTTPDRTKKPSPMGKVDRRKAGRMKSWYRQELCANSFTNLAE